MGLPHSGTRSGDDARAGEPDGNEAGISRVGVFVVLACHLRELLAAEAKGKRNEAGKELTRDYGGKRVAVGRRCV